MTLLLQGGPEPSWSLDGLIQAAIVFIFFVIPVLRAIAEGRKKRKAKAGGAPQQRRTARDLERQGRDLWREILGGGERAQSPPRAPASKPPVAAAPVARKPRVPSTAPAERTPDERVAAESESAEERLELERAVRERRRRAHQEAQRSAFEPAAFEPIAVDPAVFEQPATVHPTLGQLEVSLGREQMRRDRIVDPATLDDELGARWDASEVDPVGAEVGPRGMGRVDWRRAVLIAELLGPPLAVRGPSAAWPGPPAALS